MTTPGAYDIMPGRELLAEVIADLDHEAEFARSCADAYGVAAIGRELQRKIARNTSLANAFRVLCDRAAIKAENLPKTKEGVVQFTARIRHETTLEIVQMLIGGMRTAYAALPAMPAVATEGEKDAA